MVGGEGESGVKGQPPVHNEDEDSLGYDKEGEGERERVKRPSKATMAFPVLHDCLIK